MAAQCRAAHELTGGPTADELARIEAALALPQNLVSHHLAALRRGGLLSDRRDGRWVYYRLAPDIVKARVGELTVLLSSEGAASPAIPCAPDEIA